MAHSILSGRVRQGAALAIAVAAIVLAAGVTVASAQVSTPPPQMSPVPTPPTPVQPKRTWPSEVGPAPQIEVRICSCRYNGESIPIGQSVCMTVAGRSVRAKCDTVVNNPSWNISNEQCPSS